MTKPPSAQRDCFFISYRRDDARGASGRLYDWLRIAFGRDKVFRDVNSIGPGKWRERIDEALASSAVCLPVIGPRWFDASSGPRLSKVTDMVRHEIITALSSKDLTLIPTLVEGARLPPRNKLPVKLRDLLEWNAYPLSEEGWEDDVRRLLAAIATCSGQAIAGDVDNLLDRACEAEARLRQLEQEKRLQTDQIRAYKKTIAAFTRRIAESPPSQRADFSRAFADLARGDTTAAEAEFERILEERSNAAKDAARDAARAARHIANLALLGNIEKAIQYYRRACELDPGHPESWRLLGHASLATGDTGGAQEALLRAAQLSGESGDTWGEMAALEGLGDLEMTLGKLADAEGHYLAAERLATDRATREPDNGRWQRDLSVSHNKLGDVLNARGDGAGALAAYGKSLSIRETLAAGNPADNGRQQDLSVSHIKIGDMLLAQGNGPEALAAYRRSLSIREMLAARNPENTQWQRSLAVSHLKIGDVLLSQGEGDKALDTYRKAHSINSALAARDPANAQWQRDLSVSHNKIGDVQLNQGEKAGALTDYRQALLIRQALVARNPASARWQRDVSVSHEKVGDVLKALDDKPGALLAYRASLAIAETLAARDPANAEWQQDLTLSHFKIGDILLAQGQSSEALEAYGYGMVIAETLTLRDTANADWQRNLTLGHIRIGDARVALGDATGALIAYRMSLSVADPLAALDRTNAQWQVDLAEACVKLGDLAALGETERCALRHRGLDILRMLRDAGRLLAAQDDGTGWFEKAIHELDNEGSAT